MARAKQPEALAKIIVERFRVFRERTEIEIGPLTILAGANSSGKSSAMMAPLLLKQTLDAPFDPGPLLLNGGHVSVTSFDDQLRCRGTKGDVVLGVETTDAQRIEVGLDRDGEGELAVRSMQARGARGAAAKLILGGRWRKGTVDRVRFMLGTTLPRRGQVLIPESAGRAVEVLSQILHVPGLRTPPQRDYPLLAVGDTFEGRFDLYVASVLMEWQRQKDDRLAGTAADLKQLGLTWKVRATRKSDTHATIEVGRLPASVRGGAHDVVEIADVGVGVSQALPVVVALRQASPGQLVYLEQPELHLHPRAQGAMAEILVAAAARGVRVVVETHSSQLLLGIQAVIARGESTLEPADVILHWFSRDPKTGDVRPATRRLDEEGAFGDWPADFDETELAMQARYLDAVEARRR